MPRSKPPRSGEIAVPDEPTTEDGGTPPQPPALAGWREQIGPTLLSVPLLTLLTGAVFPLVLAALARPLFSHQADGSLIRGDDGGVIGSEWIGQNFSEPGYFHPRPSAAGKGYDATASGGSNLGPAEKTLHDDIRRRADEYRHLNEVPPETPIPIDAVTSSGSGLDPHISPTNAALQVARVARARGLSEETVHGLVAEHTAGRQLGFLGAPRVAVLPLNLALDRIAPLPPAPPAR
jgi:K+-transporting ATPase ATPase C chain